MKTGLCQPIPLSPFFDTKIKMFVAKPREGNDKRRAVEGEEE